MPRATSLNVLLVEDNPGDADLVLEMLRGTSGRFDVLHVTGLAEAEAALRKHAADAILLDLSLPGSRGLETLERALELPTGAPLIVLSGMVTDDIRSAAIEAGAQDVIEKGEPAAELLARALQLAVDRERAAPRQMEELLSVTPDAVIVVGERGQVRFVNRAAQEFFGRSKEEFMAEPLAFTVQDGLSIEVESDNGDGARMGEMRVVRFEWNGEPAYLASIREITDVRRLRTQLVSVQSRLRQVLASSAAIVCSHTTNDEDGFDPDFALQFVSESVTRILGYSVEQAEAPGWWLRHVHPDDWRDVRDALRALALEESKELQFRMRRQDDEYRWMNVQASAVHDDHDASAEVVSVWLDVTERINLERQLRMSQRMEAVGMLAGGVAHDFNNLLTVIFSSADLALETLTNGEPARGELSEILEAADRASALTRQLLAFSRQQVLAPRLVNLNDIVEGTKRLLDRLIEADVRLLVELEEELNPVYVDPGQMEQVIINLAVNARDAMPEGGTIIITTANVHLDEAYTEDRPYVTPGDYVSLSVTDSGVGMDEETQARIFEPFFTTKDVGSGTGLGLASVYGIAKQSEGHIQVYSELGSGSKFTVYLPRAEGETTSPATEKSNTAVVGGSETILLVEDEPAVRSVGQRILNGLGYHVLVAEDGEEALWVSSEHGGEVHLLLTDLVMPGMGGPELAEKLRESRPHTKVLFTSGYSKAARSSHLRALAKSCSSSVPCR